MLERTMVKCSRTRSTLRTIELARTSRLRSACACQSLPLNGHLSQPVGIFSKVVIERTTIINSRRHLSTQPSQIKGEKRLNTSHGSTNLSPYKQPSAEERTAFANEFSNSSGIHGDVRLTRLIAQSASGGRVDQIALRRKVRRYLEMKYLQESEQLLRRAAGDETASSYVESYVHVSHILALIKQCIMLLDASRAPMGGQTGKPTNRFLAVPQARVGMEEMDEWKALQDRYRELQTTIKEDAPESDRLMMDEAVMKVVPRVRIVVIRWRYILLALGIPLALILVSRQQDTSTEDKKRQL